MTMTHYLSSDAEIVSYKPLENSVFETFDGSENDLEYQENDSVQALMLDVIKSSDSDIDA